MTPQEKLIESLESKRCPNSTDGNGRESDHRIVQGICFICDRTVYQLSILHGIG